MRLVLLGPPGAGKGTLSETLVAKYKASHISTGDIFREHQRKQTEFGKLLASYIDKGLFVPDEIVLQIIADHLKHNVGQSGFIFDGFPRTVGQAEALDDLLQELDLKLDGVVCLNVSVDMLVQRLVHRRVCPQCKAVYHLVNKPPHRDGVCDADGVELVHRPDDCEEVIKERMDLYNKNTQPLIDFYRQRGLLLEFDGSKSPQEVGESVCGCLDKLG